MGPGAGDAIHGVRLGQHLRLEQGRRSFQRSPRAAHHRQQHPPALHVFRHRHRQRGGHRLGQLVGAPLQRAGDLRLQPPDRQQPAQRADAPGNDDLPVCRRSESRHRLPRSGRQHEQALPGGGHPAGKLDRQQGHLRGCPRRHLSRPRPSAERHLPAHGARREVVSGLEQRGLRQPAKLQHQDQSQRAGPLGLLPIPGGGPQLPHCESHAPCRIASGTRLPRP